MKTIIQSSIITFVALFIMSELTYADTKYPVGFALEIGAEKELPLGFDIGLFGEIHTCQTFNTLEHYCFIVHAGNTILPWLHAEIGYQFLDVQNAEDRDDIALGWNKMHRAFGGLEGTYTIKGFALGLRERYDFTSLVNDHILRSRLHLEYDFQRAPIGLSASAELLNDLTSKFRIRQVFYRLGFAWYVAEHHTLELCGGFNQYDFQEEECGFLIELGYEMSF